MTVIILTFGAMRGAGGISAAQLLNTRAGFSSPAFEKADQLADWHGYDVGSAPGCRNTLLTERRPEDLRDHCADDCRDPAFAIEHRCSRSTVVDGKAVSPLIYFEKAGASESALCCVLHKSATDGAWLAIGVGQCHDTVVRHERRHPDRNAARGGNRGLQFKHGQFFCPGAGDVLNAD